MAVAERVVPGSEPPVEPAASVDVVVIGSGAAALSAALYAAVNGARVIVLEKADVVGGTTALSGSCSWIPQHHHMAKLGVSDSREEALDYIHACAPDGWHNAEAPLWAAFVDHAPEMLKFLEAHSPLKFGVNRDPDPYEAAGAKAYGRNVSPRPIRMGILGPWRDKVRAPAWPQVVNYEEVYDGNYFSHPKQMIARNALKIAFRKLTGRRTQGGALVAGLLKGCLDHGVEVRLETAARRLTTDDGGRVTGVVAEVADREVAFAAAKGVVLATGGFEWNPEMMARYLPGPIAWCGSPQTNTGDGQSMAQAVGARLDRMDQALTMGTMPVTYEGQIQGRPGFDYFLPHSMIVNRHGKRFINEKQMNVGLAWEARDPETGIPVNHPAWRIYDAQYMGKYSHALPGTQPDGERLYRGDTLDALARQIGVDPAGLSETAARFSGFARSGRDEDFGRGLAYWDRARGGDPRHKPSSTLGTIEVPPFYAVPFHCSYLGTKGGARTNERAQVLHEDGNPIPGLYAAGNVMANPFGSKAVGAGTTIGPCLTWGYIAARDILHRPAA